MQISEVILSCLWLEKEGGEKSQDAEDWTEYLGKYDIVFNSVNSRWKYENLSI